jgi:hypothetical protein
MRPAFVDSGKIEMLVATGLLLPVTTSSPTSGVQQVEEATNQTTATLVYNRDVPDPSIIVVARYGAPTRCEASTRDRPPITGDAAL